MTEKGNGQDKKKKEMYDRGAEIFTCHRVEYDRVIITSDLTRPFQMDSVGYILLLLSCQEET